MNIIDKAKDRAAQLTHQAKEKVDDLKDSRRAEALYGELGRIAFRQHITRPEVGDTARASALVAELRALETGHPETADAAHVSSPPPPSPG
ncbi:MAG: hypothetical protein RI958_983 [Actinomycetota bacterium]|jgi:hypothetical protein